MIISLIAAISENYVIGKNRGMPWNMPADLKYFFKITRGHHVIMGRKTFNEYGVNKPLPDRTNIIVSRNSTLHIEGAIVVGSLEKAIEYCYQNGETEAFVIGGGEIYKQGITFAHKLYITVIHTIITDGDTFFPEINPEEWDLISSEKHQRDNENPFDYSFNIYHRKSFQEHIQV